MPVLRKNSDGSSSWFPLHELRYHTRPYVSFPARRTRAYHVKFNAYGDSIYSKVHSLQQCFQHPIFRHNINAASRDILRVSKVKSVVTRGNDSADIYGQPHLEMHNLQRARAQRCVTLLYQYLGPVTSILLQRLMVIFVAQHDSWGGSLIIFGCVGSQNCQFRKHLMVKDAHIFSSKCFPSDPLPLIRSTHSD